MPGSDGSGGLLIACSITLLGKEQVEQFLGFSLESVLAGSAGGSIIAPESELFAIWQTLDDTARRDLICVARAWSANQV